MGVGWGGPGMWGVRKLPLIGVQRPVCRALVSAPRAGKREHPWGPEQTASDHPAEAWRSPHGGVLLDGEMIPTGGENEGFGADTARRWGHGKRRTENARGAGEFQGWSRGSYLKHSETQSVPTNGEKWD